MAGLELKSLSQFSSDKVNLKNFFFSGTATAGQSTNIDFKLLEERLIYGGQTILLNQAFDDYMKFQVVDVDNIMGYGANFVLGEFIEGHTVWTDKQEQKHIQCGFPTKVIAGLYLRLVYVSTGQVNVKVKCNIDCVKNITGI